MKNKYSLDKILSKDQIADIGFKKAVAGRFVIINGKSERQYRPYTVDDGIDPQETLNDLLKHPDVMNMPSVFVLDADKTHRDSVVDQWILANNVGVNIAPDEEYRDNSGYKYMAIDIRIGCEPTLIKLMQQIVASFPEQFKLRAKTRFDCERAIAYPVQYWKHNYRSIFIIRDFENILALKRRHDREMFANILKYYYNSLHCSFVFTGTQNGAHALNITDQFSWRFLHGVIDFDFLEEVEEGIWQIENKNS